jgi:diguanylate cyclase (GGDEF)-like protein/PAS domain S-box-containing protein
MRANRVTSVLGWRPSLRVGIVAVSASLVGLLAFAVSSNVSDNLARTAVNEATRNTEAVIHGFVDPLLSDAPNNDIKSVVRYKQAQIDRVLEQLVAPGQLLRIKIWAPDGTVVYSDLPELRGRNFGVAEDLQEALEGEESAEFSNADEDENEFEHGLADELLSIYLPIRANTADGEDAIGVYEVYEDAGPILSSIDATRREVLLIVGGTGLLLLVVLFLGFAGSSQMLSRQNRLLRSSDRRYRSLALNSTDVTAVTDANGIVTFESSAVERVLGFNPDAYVGQPVFAGVHADDRAAADRLLADVIRNKDGEATTELRQRHADGRHRWTEVQLKNLLDDEAVGGVVVNFRDVTERRQLEEELRHQAFHDSLTGLANRALFIDRLEHAMSRKRGFGVPLGVLFIDIDDFKTINDSLGHGEGDRLLVAVARRLQEVLRSGDTIARMGGDEFAVLLEDTVDGDAPIDVAERIRTALQAPFGRGRGDFFVRASIGMTAWNSSEETAEDLIRNADIAMYTAKSAGKNRVEIYEPKMHAAAMARLALRGDLERAMERREFFVVYQPIVCMNDGSVTGVEALVRWRHPERGLVYPTEFISLAEETGLVVNLGSWVLDQACRQVRVWDSHPDFPNGLGINVNVSARQLEEATFVSMVAATLEASRLPAERLTLEFTENLLLRDTDRTIETLNALKSLGVRLSIDDFGTGYSSLSYLRRLPIDEIKIDRSFVSGISDDGSSSGGGAAEPEQVAVVRSIVELAETLRLKIVAEGIETKAQWSALRKLDAEKGQGFLFSQPLTAEELPVALTRTRRVQPPAQSARPVQSPERLEPSRVERSQVA